MRARANVAAHEAKRVDARKEELQSLYTQAGTFVIDEASADKMIEETFENKRQFRNEKGAYGENIWHLGYPITVLERLQGSRQSVTALGNDAKDNLVKDRMKRISETLTGGKLPSDDKNGQLS